MDTTSENNNPIVKRDKKREKIIATITLPNVKDDEMNGIIKDLKDMWNVEIIDVRQDGSDTHFNIIGKKPTRFYLIEQLKKKLPLKNLDILRKKPYTLNINRMSDLYSIYHEDVGEIFTSKTEAKYIYDKNIKKIDIENELLKEINELKDKKLMTEEEYYDDVPEKQKEFGGYNKDGVSFYDLYDHNRKRRYNYEEYRNYLDVDDSSDDNRGGSRKKTRRNQKSKKLRRKSRRKSKRRRGRR